MRVASIYRKGSGKVNEDQLLVKGNLFAVFDGVTSLVPFIDRRGNTGGRIAAEIAQRTFASGKGSFAALAKQANKNINLAMQKMGIDTHNKIARWAVAAAAARILPEKIEIFNVSDCSIIALRRNGSHALLTKYFNHDKELLTQWKELGRRKVKNIREILDLPIKKVRTRVNLDYGAINGEPRAVKFFYSAVISRKEIVTLLIFTDGLLLPKADPGAPEDWDRFVKIYRKGGLRELVSYVRRLEKSDPFCWKYPRYKKYDDIAAIAIENI